MERSDFYDKYGSGSNVWDDYVDSPVSTGYMSPRFSRSGRPDARYSNTTENTDLGYGSPRNSGSRRSPRYTGHGYDNDRYESKTVRSPRYSRTAVVYPGPVVYPAPIARAYVSPRYVGPRYLDSNGSRRSPRYDGSDHHHDDSRYSGPRSPRYGCGCGKRY